MAANGAVSRLASRLFGGALASRAAAGAVGGSGAGALAAAAGRLPTAAAGTGASFRGASRSAWRSIASEGVGVQPLLPRRALSSITAFGTGAAAATAGAPVRRLLGGALNTAASAALNGSSGGALVAARRMATDAAAAGTGGLVLVTQPAAQYSPTVTWLAARLLSEFFTFLCTGAILHGMLFLYYMDTVPYTGRRRALQETALENLDWWGQPEGHLVPEAHPSSQLVRRVGTAVAAAACNGDGGEHAKRLEWEFVVVEDAGLQTWACPRGKVTVTTGMLDFLGVDRNPEDGEAALAWVLAREAAHLLARHPEETRTWVISPATFCASLPGIWWMARTKTFTGNMAALLLTCFAVPMMMMMYHKR
ncbi:hypothetical protein HYH03_009087 [Edaphochlamys debaryana]|uniref:Peptidase M48 domain-containing protein n=1 Tax=Edaphochlamys debaryana TaxID=47281 RepID=A0A836BY66_9CHLO|nr:hypothetical protein HYH03_009087 [Edaphochlamys debaryana]|eukprot:KAG2492672.1 hypothetical protein HYH03_009087 [Edaphochlamys debaryana]